MERSIPNTRNGSYRRDIDGLRAIAVLLVVCYHIQLHPQPAVTEWLKHHISNTLGASLAVGLSGGFIGVDIFFVISGYLISGIILRELESSTFSVSRFYERRVRRILPALTAMFVFTFSAAYATLLPSQMLNFARSMLASLFSLSNLYFSSHSGYFDEPSLSEPLLHTWSLSVEEQFYLTFPVLLLVLHRYARKWLTEAVMLLALVSFVLSSIGVYQYPTAAFYLLPSRAWELLIGTLLALEMRAPSTRLASNLCGILGLAFIGYAAVFYNGSTRFPGVAALLPALGAALIIYGGMISKSIVGRLLSTPPLVFFGLISYSFYLWHWPVLLINKFNHVAKYGLSPAWLFGLLVLVSFLSWKFIEQPFRRRPVRLDRRQVFLAAGASTATLSVLALWPVITNGIPSRYPAKMRMVAQYLFPTNNDNDWGPGCFVSASQSNLPESCLSLSSQKPNYLLFGDSQAAQLWHGLARQFPEIHWLEATGSACPPILSSLKSPEPFCRNLVNFVYNNFLPEHHVDAIIVTDSVLLANLPDLQQSIRRLHATGTRVYVIGPNVLYDQPLVALLVKARMWKHEDIVQEHRAFSSEEYAVADSTIQQAVLASGADRYISLRTVLCPDSRCLVWAADGAPMEYDHIHLTSAGSSFVAERFKGSAVLP